MSIASEITRINNAVSTQTDLISQIATALEGKAGGSGGSSGGASVETCTVIIGPGISASGRFVAYTSIDESGDITAETLTDFTAVTPLTCVCGSVISLTYPVNIDAYAVDTVGGELLIKNTYGLAVRLIAQPGETASIIVFVGSGSGGAA